MKESTVPEKVETQVPTTREETRTLIPTVDIFEVPDGLSVIVDLPGVEKGDAEVHVEGETLTISGKVKAAAPGDILFREYELANYFRQFQLTDEVDQDKIKADLRSGVLAIFLPKAERAKPKKIAVSVKS